MTKYKAGDEVTIMLNEHTALALNNGYSTSFPNASITAHKPKPDLLDEALRAVKRTGSSIRYPADIAIEKLVQYLIELRKVN